LVAEEQNKFAQNEQMKEWESTIEMVRLQAKSESDQQLARIMREKEELEQRLRDAEVSKVDNNVVINLDTVEYPSYWDPQTTSHQSYDVKKGSDEWVRISTRFNESLPHQKIHRIERNQNKNLWMWFYLKKKELEAKNANSKGANEQFVFHGSRANAYDIILTEGFDHRVANMGGAIGAGIYFAVSSATSSGYVSGQKQHKKCYIVVFLRVMLVRVSKESEDLRKRKQVGCSVPKRCCTIVLGLKEVFTWYLIIINVILNMLFIITHKEKIEVVVGKYLD